MSNGIKLNNQEKSTDITNKSTKEKLEIIFKTKKKRNIDL